jgi:heptosyltransferase II
MKKNNCNNILVRGVNWIGDAVMTMPALRAIKRTDPDAAVTLLVKPWVSQLFEKDPNVDRIILYSDLFRGLTGKFRLAQEIRKQNFCLAVLFQNAFDAALLALLARIPSRAGYDRDGRGLLLTEAVPCDNQTKSGHQIRYYLNLVEKSGFTSWHELPWIYLSIEERIEARDRLKNLKRPVTGINPGATFGSSKRWHPSRFAEVAYRAISEMGGSAVIFGGPSETGIAEEIEGEFIKFSGRSEMKSQLLNMAGKTDLRQLISMISECDLLVTNDSGPMHIGYAVRTPVVAIFGSTSPEHTGPAGRQDVVIRKPVDCAPCFRRECRKKSLDCMDMIFPDEVFHAMSQRVNLKRAVFFDRDGTLCKDPGYLRKMEDLVIFPGVDLVRRLKDLGFLLIGVTNQSGIARGLVDEDFVKLVNGIFIDKYGFDGFYFCPHHPDEHCSCRKPEPGLLQEARVDYNIDLKSSYVIGDRDLDMVLAKAVGATGILVKTGQEKISANADHTAGDIREAVDLILSKEGK